MSGHTVTTCWWHRLWTTQVHTERKTPHVKLIAHVFVFKWQCQKVEKETICSAHLGTGNPAFQKHPYNRDRHTIRPSWQSTQINAGSCDSTFIPDELFTVKTEGWLAEESGHELVSVDLVDPTSHGALPLPCKLLVGLLFHYGVIWQQDESKSLSSNNKRRDAAVNQSQIHPLTN